MKEDTILDQSVIKKIPLLDVLSHGDFARTLSEITTPLAYTDVPGRRIYFVTEPSLVAEAALTKSSAFRDRQDVDAGCGGIVDAVGDAWKRRRDALRLLQKKSTLEGLAANALSDAMYNYGSLPYAFEMDPVEIRDFSKTIVSNALHAIILSSPSPHRIAPNQPASLHGFQSLPLLIASNILRKAEQASSLLFRKPFFELARQFTDGKRQEQRLALRLHTALTPELRKQLPSTGHADDFLRDEVHARWRAFDMLSTARPDLESDVAYYGDILDSLLACSADPSSNLSAEEVLDVVKDLLTAGVQTTTNMLTTAVLLLQNHNDAAARVAKEANEVLHYISEQGVASSDRTSLNLGKARPRTKLHAFFRQALQPQALQYTRAVLLEASRLSPAASLIMRTALHDTTLGGVRIPKGSGLVASTWCLGRHESWENPNEFIPERFLPGHELYRSAESAKAYMAFGAGPRSCIGQQLALAIASCTLSQMVLAKNSLS